MRQAGPARSFVRRLWLVTPFVVGGLAAAWLVRESPSGAVGVVGWVASILATTTAVLLFTGAPVRSRRRRPKSRAAEKEEERWAPRPFSSLAVRALAILAPMAVALATALALKGFLPDPEGSAETLANAGILMGAAFLVLYPAERATRKLAPIVMLLKLSLSFPGAAPSRFAVARRSANADALRKEIQHAQQSWESVSETAGTILALMVALTAHDSRTRGHSERVRVFAEMLGQELHLDEGDRERLRWAALLHDIGKLAVPETTLNQAEPLTEAQWEQIHRHPDEGARLIAPLVPWLGEWANAIVQHHERLDGTGYPRGLSRNEISLGARIIAVADAYDTMVTPRAYHEPLSVADAQEEVVRVSGTQFDPRVVRALLSLSIPRLWLRVGLATWVLQVPFLRSRYSSEGGRTVTAASSPSFVATAAALAAVAVATVLPPLGGGDAPGRPVRTASGIEVALEEAEGPSTTVETATEETDERRPDTSIEVQSVSSTTEVDEQGTVSDSTGTGSTGTGGGGESTGGDEGAGGGGADNGGGSEGGGTEGAGTEGGGNGGGGDPAPAPAPIGGDPGAGSGGGSPPAPDPGPPPSTPPPTPPEPTPPPPEPDPTPPPPDPKDNNGNAYGHEEHHGKPAGTPGNGSS